MKARDIIRRIRQLRLDEHLAIVLFYMASYADYDGRNCYAGVNLLAEDIGCSTRTVKRRRKKLKEMGYLTYAGPYGRVDMYHLTLWPAGGLSQEEQELASLLDSQEAPSELPDSQEAQEEEIEETKEEKKERIKQELICFLREGRPAVSLAARARRYDIDVYLLANQLAQREGITP